MSLISPPREHIDVIHLDPPTSPSRMVLGRPRVAVTLLVALLALALAARIDHSRLLLHFDQPIERFVIAHRGGALDGIFRHISFFGSTNVVLIGGGLLALLALPKCRLASAFIVTATLIRPLFEFTLKVAVDRQRPQLSQLVHGAGPSFPSGHVLAASVLWFMVPLVVTLYVPSRRVWWATTAFSVVAVFLIGCSRVYLGVHWPTDVLGGFIAGTLLLAGLDLAFRTVHDRLRCDLRYTLRFDEE